VSGWSSEELQRIGSAEELRLAARRPGGSLRPFTTMWVVQAGDDLYVRSAGGPERPWFHAASASREGRIQAGGIDAEVEFAAAAPEENQEIDAAYHAKYDRYGPVIVGHVTGPAAHAVTIRLIKAVQ
jgi:hypothetical protein